jgi:uncharacterized protein YdhG (YjbR/CyaY superfamily)
MVEAMTKTRSRSVAEYLAKQPKASQRALRNVRRVIRKALPDAQEVISYGIPAYRVHGYVALFFAGWRDHYSLYPVNARLVAALRPSSGSYEVNDKGTIKFPFSEPVPENLIGKIAKMKATEAATRRAAASARKRTK